MIPKSLELSPARQYSWLEQPDSPRVRHHLDEKNRELDAFLARHQSSYAALLRELQDGIGSTDVTPPTYRDPYWYFTRTDGASDYVKHVRVLDRGRRLDARSVAAPSRSTAADEILLDEEDLARGGYARVAVVSISPDHRRIAYAVDAAGDERYELVLRHLPDGSTPELGLGPVRGPVAWTPDGSHLLFIAPGEERRHTLKAVDLSGPGAVTDVAVFAHPVGLSSSSDRKAVFLTAATGGTRSVHAVAPTSPPSLAELCTVADCDRLLVDTATVEGCTAHLVLHHSGAAPHGTLQIVSGVRAGEVLRTGSASEPLETFRAAGPYVVLAVLRASLMQLEAIDLRTGRGSPIRQPDETYHLFGAQAPDLAKGILRFGYSSPTRPAAAIDYSLDTAHRTVVKRMPVRGYEEDDWTFERVAAVGDDGTPVPVSVIRARTAGPPRPAPMVLYVYGSYGLSLDVAFSPARLGLLRRGFSWAIAHVRGGGELGPEWHMAGRGRNKMVSVTDLEACLSMLCERGYTSPDRVVVRSRSAGALLLGALLNRRPTSVCGAVAEFPFVDCLTSLSRPGPGAEDDRAEFGDPNESLDEFRRIEALSPFENVAGRPYPPVYVRIGFNDPRVAYWEGAKWAARLQACGTAGNPVFLRTQYVGGHGGSSNRSTAQRQEAEVQTFILSCVQSLHPDER